MAFFEINKDRKWTAAIILGIGIILIAAIIAYSRSLAGLFFAFSSMLFLKKTVRYLLPFKIITAAFAVFLLISAVIASIWTIYPVTVSKDTTAELLTVNIHTSYDIRAFLGTAAVNMALKYPLFGVGQGVFTDEVKHYVDLSVAKNTSMINDHIIPGIDPHSVYFGALAETGLLGLAAICLFLTLLLRTAWILINKSCASTWKTISTYFFWGFIGYLITGFFVDILSIRSFWLLGALLLSASNIAEPHENDNQGSPSPRCEPRSFYKRTHKKEGIIRGVSNAFE
ncbi:MAG: O-antigen ligase family protein [Proteobacteria bacterium]|nr:O-antigen ligase family protein [Pseudomonadota bacterium]